ncbi:MAG: tetratricopeptide repeat protein [Ktedonobacteraceae bacterium]
MTQTTLRDYLLTTEDAISSGRVNDAMANCQHILAHFPESLEAQRLLGEVFLAQGQLDEAQQTFDWVLTNDPENVIVYCDRALISEQMQEYDTALDCYQQAYELSRGNSVIRREFNELSEKVGQTGFIFSRAGLARLYMRGDLLPQAIQEWEIVLSSSPERLDARTGLLEAFWREGLYDRVEQLATLILNDVPGCLKALLLLAHVTFAQNATKAQELLRQATLLDPDLIKAQELFSDFMAHSSKDPFLNLLHTTPTAFPTTSQGKQAEAVATTPTEQSTNGTNGNTSSPGSTPFADPLVRWSSLDNIIEPQQEYQTVQEASSFGGWSDNSTTDFGGWSTFGQQQQPAQTTPIPPAAVNANPSQHGNTNTPNVDSLDQPTQHVPVQDEQHAERWPSQAPDVEKSSDTPDAPVTQEQDNQEQQQPWYHVDVFEEPSFDSWNDKENATQSSSGISWGSMEEQESENPAPPAWLDMLTKSEPSPSNSLPPAQPIEPHLPVASSLPSVEPEADLPPSWSEQLATSSTTNPPSLDADEPFFFGPAWLKSLGAAEMESSLSPIVSQNVPYPQEEKEELPSALLAQPIAAEQPVLQEQIPISKLEVEQIPSPFPEAEINPTPVLLESAAAIATPPVPPATPLLAEAQENVTFENWLDHAAQKLNQPQQNLLTTLEELENDLRSRGFMPLQPGELSSFADETSDETLSSALAQFGNHKPQPEHDAVPAQSAQQETPLSSLVEPLWAAPPPVVQTTQPTLQPVRNQVNEQAQQKQPSATPNHLDALSSFVSQATPAPLVKTPVESVRADMSANNAIANARPNPTPTAAHAPATAAIHSDLLDMELETTMKRPAVRLQSMQQRHSTQPAQQQSTASRGQLGERSTFAKTSDGGTGAMGYKERLLRGYQHQLAGSYDDAMQEYRIIIRNAPDLLGDVVSNMRALLKIAPKYSAGYRVLGDAYMRQGEYLQAMEAYNKALSMAKKAKS